MSTAQIIDALKQAGIRAVSRQSTRGSGKAEIIEIQGHKEITQIQVHPGGGRHSGSYIKISTNSGTVKVVDSTTYKPDPKEKVTIVEIREKSP